MTVSHANREDIIEVLDLVGKTSHLFYCWLTQYDKLSEDYQGLIYPILGTQTWQRISRFAGQFPEDLDIKTVRLLACGQSRNGSGLFRYDPTIRPPAESSRWREFYRMDDAIYQASILTLNALVERDMMTVEDDGIFEQEHRF